MSTNALLVEDDQKSRFALGVMLERLGITVIAATNGAAALQTLKHSASFDVVPMDIMMPIMDGYQTMTAIRKIPACKDLPIVAVTAKVSDGEHNRCIAAGASDYIPKLVNAIVGRAITLAGCVRGPGEPGVGPAPRRSPTRPGSLGRCDPRASRPRRGSAAPRGSSARCPV
jgi:CheY-like chemotaxis protein